MTRREEVDDLHDELAAWLERYVARELCTPRTAQELREEVWDAPGEVASELLCAWVLGEWDLDDDELARLWLLGRVLAGYPPHHLISDEVLTRAAPGRGVRPLDPAHWQVEPPLLAGGGHGPGRGRPGKREFPATWSDDDTIAHTMDVAKQPSGAVELPSGDFRAWGERDGIRMSVIVSPTGSVVTSYPVDGDGVVQNAVDEVRAPHIARLRSLLENLPADDDEPRRSLEELLAAGEWPHVVASLRALNLPMTDEQRAALTELASLAGLRH